MTILTTKRHLFLEEMERVLPWGTFRALIAKHYTKTSRTGRPKKDLTLMLKIYFLQQWYNLSDEEVEEAVCDSQAFRTFTGLEMYTNANGHLEVDCPDATTILRFRHFLEEHRLQEKLFDRVNAIFAQKGYLHQTGTIIDSSIIRASSSTKNRDRKRDAAMSSTKKNNTYFFGAKVHIGVDAESDLIHTLHLTTAKVSDRKMFTACLHGEEHAVFADKGYISRDDKKAWRTEGKYWGVLDKASAQKKLSTKQRKRNAKLSSVRAKVEHPFRVIKHQWGHARVRYKGLLKNELQWYALALLHNIYILRRELLQHPLA